jgi:hypothetical protein
MAETRMRTKTRAGRCPAHGSVQATKEVPVFTPPGLFWVFRYLASAIQPYRCPDCGARV